MMTSKPVAVTLDVGIIGAGLGGIVAALELKKTGRSFVIFERAQEPGGVWRENIYPGCACDIRSHLYSIAGAPNPEWTTLFATQPEILRYLKDVVMHNELQRFIRVGVEIVSARFLEQQVSWQLTDQHGQEYKVRTVVLAVGSHNRPWKPNFRGAEIFRGELFNSATWNPSVILDGKRVAVIGTGASAAQIVPSVASRSRALSRFSANSSVGSASSR